MTSGVSHRCPDLVRCTADPRFHTIAIRRVSRMFVVGAKGYAGGEQQQSLPVE
jgi:hypothetical protein